MMLAELLQVLRDDPTANEWTLIRSAQEERGIPPYRFTEGQVALARWLMTAERVGVVGGAFNFLISPLGSRDTLRQLSGESEPCELVANQMAEWSEGAIKPSMWARSCAAPDKMPDPVFPPVAGKGGAADGNRPSRLRPPQDIQVSDRLSLTRKPDGAMLIRTPAFVALIEEADLPLLYGGIGAMLGREAVAA